MLLVLVFSKGGVQGGDLFPSQIASRRMAGVLIPSMLNISEILRPGKESALAQPFLRRRAGHFHPDAPLELDHQPIGNFRALGWIDKPEQDQMAEQHAPV